MQYIGSKLSLLSFINETIEELKKDGTYKKIYDKWFGAE